VRDVADIDADLEHERTILRVERRSGEKTNGTLRALDRLDELLDERAQAARSMTSIGHR